LLAASNYLTQIEAESPQLDAIELVKLLTSSLKTARANMNH